MALKRFAGLVIALSTGSILAQERGVAPLERPPAKPIPPSGPARPEPPAREDAIPGLEETDYRLPDSPVRREGSFVVRQRGSMVRLPGGQRAFIFHKDASGKSERPMILLRCQTLHLMELAAGDRDEMVTFIMTGQIYMYQNVNYLLPTAAPVMSPGSTKQEDPKPAETEAPPTRDEQLKDPRVQDLIRDLEAQSQRVRTLAPGTPAKSPTAEPPPRTSAASAELMPEPSSISRRRGRIVRVSTGDWGLAIDNGPTGGQDQTLIIQPCLNLERLESWTATLGDGATIQVSGRVFQYSGRNYILPTMFQVNTPSELEPRH